MKKQPFLISFYTLLRWNMLGAYMLLLHVAASLKELRFLHDVIIPDNCRLLREDVVLLEQAWKARHQTPGWPKRTELWDMDPSSPARGAFLHDFERARDYFLPNSHDSGVRIADLRTYYAEVLQNTREYTFHDMTTGECILSSPQASGHGYFHFEAHLRDTPDVELQLGILRNGEGFYAILSINTRDLTEPITHAFLRDLGKYSKPARGYISGDIGFSVLLNTDLSEHTSKTAIGVSSYSVLVASDGFLPALQRAFDAAGLKVTVDRALTYEDDADDESEPA